jgi:hypothetical protein
MKKLLLYFVAGFLFTQVFLQVFLYVIRHSNKPNAKYTVYTAGQEYKCNHFTISGKTIYFNDVEGNRVFINGDFSVVYEKKVSEE